MQRRNTRQRKLVLDVVRGRCDHPTAEQIYQSVVQEDPNVSRGTVYRNLAVLVQEGLVLQIDAPDANHYDLRCDPHHHLICTRCAQVIDVDVPYDAALDESVGAESGYAISGHQMLFYGVCPSCSTDQ